ILLKSGRVLVDSTAAEAVEQYQQTLMEMIQAEDSSERVYTAAAVPAGFKSIRTELLRRDDDELDLRVSYDLFSDVMSRRLEVGLEVVTRTGVRVASFPPRLTNFGVDDLEGSV